MYAFFILGLSAFILCLIFTPVCRDLCLRFGLVDQPDSKRKFHLRAVPRIGGIPIALSYAGALGCALWFNPNGSRLYIQHHHLFHALIPAAALIFITGLLDDLVSLKPWQKLLGQFLAAATAVTLGARLAILPTHPSVAIVLSILWLIACSNAINLIDGMDGLATGVGLLATLTTLIVACLSGNMGLALATVPLAGALLAFLNYNFSPASVFLGDCGSLTIGFFLGCFSLAWSQHAGSMLGMLAPLMVLSLPLVDVGLAVGRRFLRSVPIFQGDRGHIHHRVQALGFSARHTALLLYGYCAIVAILAVLQSFSGTELLLPILLIFCVVLLLGVRRLRYIEFGAARRALTRSALRHVIQDQIYLEELRADLLIAHNAEEWWETVRLACGGLSFTSAHLELDTQVYSAQFTESADHPTCRIHLGLGDRGLLVLTRGKEEATPRHMMAVLNEVQLSLNHIPGTFATAPATRSKTAISSAA